MKLIKRIMHFFQARKIPTLAGAICFYLIVSAGSFLFLLATLSSYLPLSIYDSLNENLPDSLIKTIILYLINHSSSMTYSVFLVITSLYSSSSLYYHFFHLVELITKRPVKYPLGKRVISLIIAPIVIIACYFGFFFLSIIEFNGFIQNALFCFLIFFIILLINKLALPDHKFRRLLKGSLFSTLFIIFFSIGFFIYLRFFTNFQIVYGMFALIIIFLFYLYICIIGILEGILINCKNLAVFSIFKKEK